MTRSGYRTVLVALGVLAVALGGALFPPTGFGGAPASETDLVGPAPADAGADGGSAGVDAEPDTPAAVDTVDPGEPATEESPATESPAADQNSATPTPTRTADPTSTPTPADDDREGGLFGLLAGLFAVVVLAVLAVAVATSAGSRGDDETSGGPGVDIPVLGPVVALFDRALGSSPTAVAGRIPQVTMVALVGVSSGTTRVLGGAASLAGEVAGGLSVVVRAGSRGAATGFGGLGSLFSLPSGSLFPLSGVPSVFGGGSTTATGRSPGTDARDAAPVEPESSEDPIESVADAWAAFAEPLAVSAPDARTPGEFARLATERGDPDGPVRRLTRVFRDVRYGGRPETPERTRSAVESVGAILAARTEEDDE